MTGPGDEAPDVSAEGMELGKKYWLDDPQHVTWIVRALTAVCIALVLADLFYHKHVYFGFEEWFGFYGFFGFAAFFFMVMAGKQLRKIVMRPEDYYDE